MVAAAAHHTDAQQEQSRHPLQRALKGLQALVGNACTLTEFDGDEIAAFDQLIDSGTTELEIGHHATIVCSGPIVPSPVFYGHARSRPTGARLS